MDKRTYQRYLRYAHRYSRRSEEASDLLQTALLLAIESNRADLTLGENRRWLCGVLRNQAAFEARSSVRRRQREANYAGTCIASEPPVPVEDHAAFARGLPAALRTTALLALTGHTRAEIRWLLDLNDVAFRKRISEIRRRWREFDSERGIPGEASVGGLALGAMRQALLLTTRQEGVVLATHDPDGHLFVVRSQMGAPRQQQVSDHS